MKSTNEMLQLIENYDTEMRDIIHQMCIDFNAKSKEEFIEKKSSYLMGDLQIDSKLTYIFHGRGCRVFDENQIEIIEWDFGYNHHWYGIDPFFLSKYIERKKLSDNFIDFEKTTDTLNKMVSDGILYKKSNLYYLV